MTAPGGWVGGWTCSPITVTPIVLLGSLGGGMAVGDDADQNDRSFGLHCRMRMQSTYSTNEDIFSTQYAD